MDTRLLAFKNLIRFFTKGDTKTLVNDYNDLFCLFLSQIVYFSPAFITKYLGELGSDSIKLIDYDGPTAICIHFNGVTYVCVKGLSGRNKSEWPIVLNFIPKEHEGTKAHGGFVLTTRKLLPGIEAFVATYSDRPVILTGHSMGGAIATLTSLSVDGCKVVTFGSPKAIEKDAANAFAEKDMMHYCIDNDFVTHLPPFIYERPGKEIVKKRKMSLLRFWDNHKLYTYSTFMMPVIADHAVAKQLNSN